jgi:hypothetical protein
MKVLEQTMRAAADLHWLATLLSGSRSTAIDITIQAIDSAVGENSFFSDWMSAWSRRLVIARALTAVREELGVSARRTAMGSDNGPAVPPRPWMLDGQTTKSNLEGALLSIDLFPKAAVLLLLFEGVPLRDAAVLLDAEPVLVRKGQAAGVVELTNALARIQGWQPKKGESNQLQSEFQHA